MSFQALNKRKKQYRYTVRVDGSYPGERFTSITEALRFVSYLAKNGELKSVTITKL